MPKQVVNNTQEDKLESLNFSAVDLESGGPAKEMNSPAVNTAKKPATDNDESKPNEKIVAMEVENKILKERLETMQGEVGQIDQLKPFLPILEDLRTDEGLRNMVLGYYDDGKAKETSKKIEIPENFAFDVDNIYKDGTTENDLIKSLVKDEVAAGVSNAIKTQIAPALGNMDQKIGNVSKTNEYKDSIKELGLEGDEEKEFAKFLGKKDKKFSVKDIYAFYLLKSGRLNPDNDELAMNQNGLDRLIQTQKAKSFPSSNSNSKSIDEQLKTEKDKRINAVLALQGAGDYSIFG